MWVAGPSASLDVSQLSVPVAVASTAGSSSGSGRVGEAPVGFHLSGCRDRPVDDPDAARQTDRMLPDLDVKRIQRWCEARTPEQFRDQVRVECDIAPRHLTVIEARPLWRADFGPEWTRQPIARLRYTKTAGTWELFWSDRNSRFHRYDLVAPTPRVEDLLAEIDRDPTAIFWG
jgi:hypothetical protein